MVVIPALKEVTELLLGRQRQTAEVLRGVDHRLPGRGCLGEFGERRVIVAVAVGVDKDRVRKRKGLEPGLRNHRHMLAWGSRARTTMITYASSVMVSGISTVLTQCLCEASPLATSTRSVASNSMGCEEVAGIGLDFSWPGAVMISSAGRLL